ncbi:MAG: hypothetical protein CML24_02210 [Rhizobiales bacterium]|nr:hypothetical protein [Hyphomicrobiales bacterium]
MSSAPQSVVKKSVAEGTGVVQTLGAPHYFVAARGDGCEGPGELPVARTMLLKRTYLRGAENPGA